MGAEFCLAAMGVTSGSGPRWGPPPEARHALARIRCLGRAGERCGGCGFEVRRCVVSIFGKMNAVFIFPKILKSGGAAHPKGLLARSPPARGGSSKEVRRREAKWGSSGPSLCWLWGNVPNPADHPCGKSGSCGWSDRFCDDAPSRPPSTRRPQTLCDGRRRFRARPDRWSCQGAGRPRG